MDPVGPVIQLLQWISAPISRCWKYHSGLKENVETLNQRMAELNSRKSDIQSRLETEIVQGETKSKEEVELWKDRVEKIRAEIETIKGDVETVKCFSRAGIGKNVVQKIEEVEKLYRTGEFTNGLILQLPRQTGEMQPTTTLGGETTFTRKMEEVWALLMDDEVRKIGVYGMGGVGKTTLMKHINNRLLESREKFDSVIWARVTSQTVIVGPWGGPGGDAWDDGIYTGIQNINLQFGAAIDSIQVDYDVNGDRSAGPHHGGTTNRSKAIKLAPEEFIVKVSGYVGPLTGLPSDVIRSLTFTTNLEIYGPYGVEEGTPFSLPINRRLVVGFTGRSGLLLDAIGVRLSL